MNERIKELAEQAKKYALDAMIKITDKEQALKAYSESYDKKFAELIVRECAMQVADVRIENDFEPVGDAVLVRALAGIKKHFGVEE